VSESLSDRYFALIDQIVELTLQGKISSVERVYRILVEKVEVGTGEVLERCLAQRLEANQSSTKLKAARILRALQTIEKQWERWQEENQVDAEISETAQSIIAGEREDYFLRTVDAIDPNQEVPLSIDELHKLAANLQAAAKTQEDAQLAQEWQQLATGIVEGLKSFTLLEADLVSWMYGSGSNFSGFGAEKPNPWRIWGQKIASPLPKQLFFTLAQQQSTKDFARVANNLELRAWIELAILLQYLQRGLVTWYDQQPYNSKFGKELSYSTLLTFASIWGELWRAFVDRQPALADGCFLVMLQILRTFAQRPDFPLYSGVFASFSGDYLQDTLDYFDEPLKQRVVQIRQTNAKQMVQALGGLFETIDPKKYSPTLTVIDNAIFGRISRMDSVRLRTVEDIIVDVLGQHGLLQLMAQSIYDLDTTLGGENLPAVFRERVAFSRAGIKKPDILILGNSLASHDAHDRDLMRERISTLLPDTTKIFIERNIQAPDDYDLFVEIVDGRIDGGTQRIGQSSNTHQDLNQKIRAIAETELFGELERHQQRLLAFGSQWYKAPLGKKIFTVGDSADAAYLCIKGSAGLYWPTANKEKRLVSTVSPGRLIGDLSVILKEPRNLNLVTLEDSEFLRIGATELMAIIENDAMVASTLMRSVADNLSGAVESLRSVRMYAMDRGVDFSGLDSVKGDEDNEDE